MLVWTTTPWTLPSNLAVCVNPDLDYAVVRRGGEQWILAVDAVERYTREIGERRDWPRPLRPSTPLAHSDHLNSPNRLEHAAERGPVRRCGPSGFCAPCNLDSVPSNGRAT
jgi:hypothetical protein